MGYCCSITEGFNDTSSLNVYGGVYYSEVYRSKIILDFWQYGYKYKNNVGLNKVVNSLILGYQKDISIKLKLAENLIKANKI